MAVKYVYGIEVKRVKVATVCSEHVYDDMSKFTLVDDHGKKREFYYWSDLRDYLETEFPDMETFEFRDR